jgi:hypothetical protein
LDFRRTRTVNGAPAKTLGRCKKGETGTHARGNSNTAELDKRLTHQRPADGVQI